MCHGMFSYVRWHGTLSEPIGCLRAKMKGTIQRHILYNKVISRRQQRDIISPRLLVMSFNYSTYGAAITDAYGTKQPPALARESNFPGPDVEPRAGKRKGDAADQKARSLQLDALKQRIHGGGGLSESKVPLGAFEPQTSGQASSTKQSTAMDQDDQAA